MDLFEYHAEKDADGSRPLAEKMRPRSLNEFVGQEHVTGKGALIRHAVEEDRIFSMILWGPPGCGKTTLASIIARETRSHFIRISAVLSGVKAIKTVIEEAEKQRTLYRKKTILFVDEIHRFNKAQQDAFLQHVESGLLTLIGATTENPSFEVIPALISRCRVIVLNPLSHEEIAIILQRALTEEERGLGKNRLVIEQDALNHLIAISDGDVRTALNGLEITASLVLSEKGADGDKETHRISLKTLEDSLQQKALRYDKNGEEHYNLISAFHKSLRGSDPDAAAYWLMRMISAGENPLYIGRRMVRFASEDIGNADSNALNVALNAVEAFRFLGHPEGELALLQAAVYLATAPKSNSIYQTMNVIKSVLKNTGTLPVPYHIRNAPTSLMKELGYGRDYKYAHEYKDAFTPQSYLPDELEGKIYYSPTLRGYEKTIKQRLDKWRSLKEKARSEKKFQIDKK
ncbi:MAG: replication-associated recombination protein A [Desulfobacterales bacterium]